jgi:diaminopimelate decarboxylase
MSWIQFILRGCLWQARRATTSSSQSERGFSRRGTGFSVSSVFLRSLCVNVLIFAAVTQILAAQGNCLKRSKPTVIADPTEYTPHYKYRQGALECENVPLTRIAEKCGTPTYIYSSASILDAYHRFTTAFRTIPHSICYAVKANSNLSILKLLVSAGSSFDIVSGGELHRLRHIGVPANRIVFSGVGKTKEEIREALQAGILLFNVESESELDTLAAEAARLKRRAPAALRVNPDVQAGAHAHISTGHHRHKFGIDWDEARRFYLDKSRANHISWRGISAHIGSQILGLAPFRRAVIRVSSLVRDLAKAGVRLSYLDLGGGVGIRYTHESPPDLDAYARAILPHIRTLGCRLLLEPGRAVVGPAGVLLTRVLHIKRNREKLFIVVDAAMNDFIRPALYQAVHPITPVVRRGAQANITKVDIVGPVCETGDCFLRDWPIALPEQGDLLVLWGAGAYGFAQSSNYNSRPRAAEILVNKKQFNVVRKRESRSDLIRGE